MAITLYELTEEWRNFELEIDEETGEVLNSEELDALQLSRDAKIENCLYYLKNLEAEADIYKAEKMRLYKKQQQTEKKVQYMKDYLAFCLNGQKWSNSNCPLKVSYRKSETVEVASDAIIPDEFLSFEPKIDRMGLKGAIKNGAEIKGVTLVEKQNMQIR